MTPSKLFIIILVFIFICVLAKALLGNQKILYDGYALINGEKLPLNECVLYYNQTHGYVYNSAKKINACFPFTNESLALMKKYHPV